MSLRRRPPSPNFSLTEITSRIRGFILDSQVNEADHISGLLGCPPTSDEVADKESDESNIRMSRVEHLIPIMYMYAKTMADGVVDHQRTHAEAELDDEDLNGMNAAAWAATRKAFTHVALNTLMGAVSQMVDMGYLNLEPEKKRKSRWKNR